MRRLIGSLLLLTAMACASSQTQPAPAASASGGTGTSCENGIVLPAKNEDDGVKAEYAWIREHYPGSKRGDQSLLQCNGKPVDQINFTDANGNKVTVYFDISGWFGKF